MVLLDKHYQIILLLRIKTQSRKILGRQKYYKPFLTMNISNNGDDMLEIIEYENIIL